MRCSSCSHEVKPVVALDIDGTLGNYHDTFTDFAGVYHDLIMPDAPWNGAGEMEDWLGLTKEQYREAKLAYRQGGSKRSLPAYPYARTMAMAMHRAGAEVWVATTRPWQRLDNIDPDTKEWLRRNQIPYDGLLYGDDKYDRLVKAIDPERILLVIDDLPEMIDRATSLGMPTFQVHRDHNQACRRTGGSLAEALELFHDQLQDWKDKHEH